MTERTERGVDTAEEEELPPFAEQMAQQLGGLRGMTEAAVPVVVFVLTNLLLGLRFPAEESRIALQWAIIASATVAVGVAIMRLAQRKPVRFAINGLFGIALGAWMAWDSGKEVDFYLPGIWIIIGQIVVLVGSILIGHPAVGWFWSVVANGGRNDWRDNARLVRVFTQLTALWAAVFAVKVVVQGSLWMAEQGTALGIARIVMGTPLFALLLVITFGVVRRVRRDQEASPA
ncbi:DUF3159 domain-containing protein [Catellatospora bangladeshensis]|uniref:Membrane protein n=1 Tax=Catellatospora bangladeshensis TaxID=310355 RepID=A0A8J3JM69_9ACTN|nr:DUF3159 domain-containing protein [Catellatospora bangladeshensis]GIF79644.1 membrane protein [Catellatospora bangladeshensis]